MPITKDRALVSSANNFGHDFSRIPAFAARSGQSANLGETPSSRTDSDTPTSANTETVFTFQTFIPDKYVPGTSGTGYGDNRGFGKIGDSYRTFQEISLQLDGRLNAAGVEGPAVAKTGVSETTVPLMSGQASGEPLHMTAKRSDAHAVTVNFDASIQNGSFVGELFPAIDFSGAVTIGNSVGKQFYGFYVSHDAFPAYEAFIDGSPIYRWSYPAGSTIADLIGSGTAIQGKRKTGDPPGGTIASAAVQEFGGGRFGGGGAGGSF